jgi:5-methylcytosine-specific restriction protein B
MSDLTDSGLVDEGAIPPDSFHDSIGRTGEVAKHRLEVPADLLTKLEQEAAHLLIDPKTLADAAAALIAGHLVLQGPPGTGKSSLAAALARAFGAATLESTAREDWTAFDIIGGQELVVDEENHEVLKPVHGWFTEAAIECAGSVSRNLDDQEANPEQATWLVIDELNRANIDRAFGELFSVLGNDDLTPLRLKYMGSAAPDLTTSRRFRIIGTLNSIDKQFVNSLSLAIRRRFTFITIGIPPQRHPHELWETPSPEGTTDSLAIQELERIVDRARNNSNPDHLPSDLLAEMRAPMASLLQEIEKIRYATESSAFPFLPVGTAQLIDVASLSVVQKHLLPSQGWAESLDWACSVKLAPLFETDLESPEKLRVFADVLRSQFPQFARELLRIESAGLYAVP